MKIQDLTDAQLDKWVALAQGWEKRKSAWITDPPNYKGGTEPCDAKLIRNYSPTSNDAQAMALVKEFQLLVRPTWQTGNQAWWASVCTKYTHEEKPIEVCISRGRTPNHAICLAVVASFYGDEVEEG